ncbi:CWF19L1 (predicted) [Pycnogonum litorale]
MLKPRYHFVSYNDILYERQPYRNHQVLAEDAQHVTRFISLSSLGNTSKKKWLYAFSITPLVLMDKSELRLQPPDVSEMPYRNVESKIETNKQNTNDKQYFYDMSAGNQQSDRKRHSKSDRFNDERKAKRQPRPQGPCWFCLSSPEVEKHLVLSVGTETYLALAKGFLVPSHVLITPIGHCRSTTELPPEALQEVQRYKNSLKRYYKSLGLTVVFFERNFRTSHLQIQCVPLPTSCDADLVKETFQNIGDSEDIELNEIPVHSDLSQIIEAGRPYFYVELQDGRKLLHRVKKGMPINFGREVLCSPPLLNMEDKIDWRKCEHTKDEETAAAAEFRDKFQPFDFSLD